MDPDVSYFARTVFRRERRPFGIRQADRLMHMAVLGRTGSGKTTLLRALARGDLAAGRGFALLDPHGDFAAELWAGATPEQRARTAYLDATDPAQPYGHNPLRRVPDARIPLAAAGLLDAFRKLWPQAWGVRMEHLLRHSLYALLERDGSTLADVLRLYRDDAFRRDVAARLRNPAVRAFWREEFEPLTERQRLEMSAPIANKLGALLADPLLRRTLAAPPSDLDLRALMDSGCSLIANLSKGQIGEDACDLLGSILVSVLATAASSRADLPPAARRPFFIYADEFQSFTTQAFAQMLPELRKTRVGVALATQHLDGIPAEVRRAVLGNAGTLAAFRLGPEDAAHLAREFHPAFGAEDLLSLPVGRFCLKLMIGGAPSQPFSAETLLAWP